ncbi:RNA polymerase II accessory factor [Coprinellus micaceus]|uniref:RNA polymerase II accessory factor n=1 Tax=Coprinellus micaceus TaxID=71717 RepID=A0A4Y7TB30_COPMI|nr:RNA polymerase II accessory factor [Coprinellus micaceus]
MTTPDALSTLQQAIKSRSPITYSTTSSPSDATPLLSQATHLTAPTRFRKPPPNHAEFYSLDALYLAWVLKDAAVAEYMKQARENALAHGFVGITERKKVVDWLEGEAASKKAEFSKVGQHSAGESGTTPASLPASGNASPVKRRYVTDSSDLEVVKRIKESEVELADRNTVLRGTKSNNFSSVQTVWHDRVKKLKASGSSGAAQSSAQSTDKQLLARKSKNNFPIIIISSSPTALITMHNVKRFLQESVFETSQAAKERSAAEGNPKPEDMIPLYRKKTVIDSSGKEHDTQSRYFVVDSVEALSKFGPDSWDRVVCVMTTGQQWQFRPYKWSEPRILFHHVKGIYISWTNDPPNHKIKDWNVTELKIDPQRRHVDKSIVASFWKTLDSWIQSNKPWLMH